MTTPANVSAGCFDQDVWIRIEGRGNFQSSGSIRKFVQAMIQRGRRQFVVDLAACDHMDSTFMGTLTGISQNLRDLGQGSLTVINVAPRNVDLMENLGLNFLFGVEAAGPTLRRPLEEEMKLMPLPLDVHADKDIILAAHEALIAANPSNAERFKDVLDYLKHGTPGAGH
jgi:anti-anti-sigma factor